MCTNISLGIGSYLIVIQIFILIFWTRLISCSCCWHVTYDWFQWWVAVFIWFICMKKSLFLYSELIKYTLLNVLYLFSDYYWSDCLLFLQLELFLNSWLHFGFNFQYITIFDSDIYDSTGNFSRKLSYTLILFPVIHIFWLFLL